MSTLFLGTGGNEHFVPGNGRERALCSWEWEGMSTLFLGTGGNEHFVPGNGRE